MVLDSIVIYKSVRGQYFYTKYFAIDKGHGGGGIILGYIYSH